MVTPPSEDPATPPLVAAKARQTLIAAFGPDVGAEATTRALRRLPAAAEDTAPQSVHALVRSELRWFRRRQFAMPEVPEASGPWIEPDLPGALRRLSVQERAAVLLHHGFGWTNAEIGEALGTGEPIVQRHIASAVGRLQRDLSGERTTARGIEEQLASYAELIDRRAPALSDLLMEPSGPWSISRFGFVPLAVLGVLVLLGVVAGLAAVTRPSSTSAALSPPSDAGAVGEVPNVMIGLVNPNALGPESFRWNPSFVSPGGVAEVDGTLHMLASTYGDGLASIGHATSQDGAVWTVASRQPVLDLSNAPWAPLEFDRAGARSLVVVDGVWQLYFDIRWLDPLSDDIRASIGRATALAPEGPWTFDAEPVVLPARDSEWHSARVSSPTVVATSDGLAMLFVGEGESGGAVGVAASSDGAEWRVRSDPVFQGGPGWERNAISSVDLIAVGSDYALWYAGSGTSQRGLAVSADLIGWAAHPGNPILGAADASRPAVFDTEFVEFGSRLFGFIEGGVALADSQVVIVELDTDLAELTAALLHAD